MRKGHGILRLFNRMRMAVQTLPGSGIGLWMRLESAEVYARLRLMFDENGKDAVALDEVLKNSAFSGIQVMSSKPATFWLISSSMIRYSI